MKLQNKHAIITGGSRGIGFAIAKEFVQQGASVLLIARNQVELEAAQKELASILDSVFICVGDVSLPSDVEKIFQNLPSDWNHRIDVLVNAAGIYGPKGLIEDVDPEAWLQTFLVNTYGTMLMIRGALPHMKKQNSGVIINFSGGGEGAFPRFSAYATSKGAIVRLTESLAEEVKETTIRINAIAPGAVNTSLVEEVLAAGPQTVGEEFYQKSLEQKESGGVSAQKAAELCVFLASDESQGLTGKVFSAVWDKWDQFPQHIKEIMETDIYSWRRIKPKDRGYDW